MQAYLVPSPPRLINEVRAFDALERIGHLLGVPIDQDDPEQAIIASIERAVVRFIEDARVAQLR